ncbi:MAG: helix-turn-helix domain-containing protein [Gemmataceae bacterium]
MTLDDRAFLQQLGDRVRDRRLGLGLTQADLGAASGLHRTFVGSVERGERNLALLTLRRLAAALRVPPAALLAAPPAGGAHPRARAGKRSGGEPAGPG